MMGSRSYAKQRREALGLESSRPVVDPELSAKRKAAAYASHVKRGLTSQAAIPALVRQAERQAEAKVATQRREAEDVQKMLEIQGNGGVSKGRQLARNAAPAVVKRLVDIAGGQHGAGVREQIAAGRLVLEVAGALDAVEGAGDDAPLNQMSAAALAHVIAAGEARIAQLEAVLAAREAETIEGDAVTVPG